MAGLLTDSRWNLRVLLAHGLFTSVGHRLAPPRVIIPYIYIAAGAPTFFAAILVPILYGISQLSQTLSAPLIASAKLRKTYLVMGKIIMLAGMVLAAVSIQFDWILAVTVIFLLAAAVVGAGQGVGSLAYSTLVPELLDKDRRSLLFSLAGGISACAAIGLALATHWYFQGGEPLISHITLVWLSVSCGIIGIVMVLFVREQTKSAGTEQRTEETGSRGVLGHWEQIKSGWAFSLEHVWFRHYIIAQILLLSITQVVPFYAIHAASLHGNVPGSLSSIIVAMSVGAILSGPALVLMARRSIHTKLIVGICAAALSAVLALLIDGNPGYQHYLYYTPIFVLLSFSMQAVSINIRVYLGEMAPRDGGEYFFSASKMFAGTIGLIVAAVLGFLAHYKHEAYPIAIILCINVIAMFHVIFYLPRLVMPAAEQAT
ncbi:MFS transporter [Roseibium aggregatum]|uniref:MFS transporter n=1 Tax=Roseibium aggregatum TaxID=187304 RepID=A0A926NY74_9HYPH|nr:MFS transporter [Roseibium aggregatum]MBD1545898.1 MFS transporter [Roseibium aggregatum]